MSWVALAESFANWFHSARVRQSFTGNRVPVGIVRLQIVSLGSPAAWAGLAGAIWAGGDAAVVAVGALEGARADAAAAKTIIRSIM